ANGGASGQVK
nr:Chain P, MAJOR OUTER MEMBRANE PROTEIN P1.16 [Neisseria meningitidis]